MAHAIPAFNIVLLLLVPLSAILGIVALTFQDQVTQSFSPGAYPGPFVLSLDSTPLQNALNGTVYRQLSAMGVPSDNFEVYIPYHPFLATFYRGNCTGPMEGGELQYYQCSPTLLGQDLNIGQYFAGVPEDGDWIDDETPVGDGENGFNIVFAGTNDTTGLPYKPVGQQMAQVKAFYDKIQGQLKDFADNDNYVLHLRPSAILLATAVGTTLPAIISLFFLMHGFMDNPSRLTMRRIIVAVHLALMITAAALFTASAAHITAQVHKVLNAPAEPLPDVPGGTLNMQVSSTFLGVMWAAVGNSLVAAIVALLRSTYARIHPNVDGSEKGKG